MMWPLWVALAVYVVGVLVMARHEGIRLVAEARRDRRVSAFLYVSDEAALFEGFVRGMFWPLGGVYLAFVGFMRMVTWRPGGHVSPPASDGIEGSYPPMKIDPEIIGGRPPVEKESRQ